MTIQVPYRLEPACAACKHQMMMHRFVGAVSIGGKVSRYQLPVGTPHKFDVGCKEPDCGCPRFYSGTDIAHGRLAQQRAIPI